VPGPGEPGHETWSGESWKHGSAATWDTGSYDPDLNLVYWGTGNPGPNYNGASRAGDNLYSASLVALDAGTGKLKWHFQFPPHDVHDWDANQIPVLIDQPFRGAPRKLLVTANRNCFLYVLDRQSGQFLLGKQYVKQDWAKDLDDRGRPILLPGRSPSVEGTPVYPSLHGGTNWFSPTYSPETGLFYVAVRQEGTIFFKGEATYTPGAIYVGGSFRGIPGEEPSGSIRAFEVETVSCAGSFRCTRRPGPGFSRPPATWFLAARTKATSSPWTPPPASRCGASPPAAPSSPTPSATRATAISTSPSPPATP
jgi:alcohol dehydrogenase (cytochrome c)